MNMNNIDVNVKAVTTPPDVTVQYKTIILKKHLVNGVNTLTQEMMSATNTKYVIKYNYVLDGNVIIIPENCLLEFDGGNIDNGIIVGNNTIMIYDKPINEVCPAERQGTFIYNTTVVDEEDITSESGQLKFKDRPATDGMGRKILRKNIVDGINTLTQSMITQPNTIYVIQYDFTLGKSITIPANCVLEFYGGSLNNGTIYTNATRYSGLLRTSNINIVGKLIKVEDSIKILYNEEDFDIIIKNQQDFDNADALVGTRTNARILLKDNVFNGTLRLNTNLTNLEICGDNATIIGQHINLKDYITSQDEDYIYFDISNNFNFISSGCAVLLDENLDVIPYNYIAFAPNLPTIVDSTLKTAKLPIPDNLKATLANKTEDFFKYSYLRFSSTWIDSKAIPTSSDSDYIYFKYYNSDTFDLSYRNGVYYGNPNVRLYNTSVTDGVYLNENKILRVPITYGNDLKFVIGTVLISSNASNLKINSLFLAGAAPYNSGVFENYSNACITLHNINSLSISNCFIKSTCGFVVYPIDGLNSVELTGNRIITYYSIASFNRNITSSIIKNNVISGHENCYGTFYLLGVHRGHVEISNNIFKNGGYDLLSLTTPSAGNYGIEGFVKSNEFYNEDAFLFSKNFFGLNDGGLLYICNQTTGTLLVEDNYVYNSVNLVGIYLDDGTKNVTVKSNIIWNTSTSININSSDIEDKNTNIIIEYNVFNSHIRVHSGTSQDNSCSYQYNFITDKVLDSLNNFSGNTPESFNFDTFGSSYVCNIVEHNGKLMFNDKYRNIRGTLFLSKVLLPESNNNDNDFMRKTYKKDIKFGGGVQTIRYFNNSGCTIRISRTSNVKIQKMLFTFGTNYCYEEFVIELESTYQRYYAYSKSSEDVFTFIGMSEETYYIDIYLFTTRNIGMNIIWIKEIEYYNLNQSGGKICPDEFVNYKIVGISSLQSLDGIANILIPKAGDVSSISRLRPELIGASVLNTQDNKPYWWNGSEWVDATGTPI